MVKDEDGLAKDDLLGTVEIDWMECFTNPSKDSYFSIKNVVVMAMYILINLEFQSSYF